MIEIHPLGAIGEVQPGSDLVAVLGDALAASDVKSPQPSDVIVITQKIVSKAEGRFVRLDSRTPSEEARRLAEITQKDARFVQLVLDESTAIVRAAPNVLITRHRCGYVMANAGIDRSNLGKDGSDSVLLLPLDCDASAARLRHGLSERYGSAPAIVISDSFGRPWRYGVVCVAIGASGLPSLVDKRGELDRDGRPLEVTQIALGDMLASAAGLAAGEGAESIPAALIRGVAWPHESLPASALIRPLSEDLFQ